MESRTVQTNKKKSRELETEIEKPYNSNKEYKQRKNNESSTKQVELSHLKEEIKYIKKENKKKMTRDAKRQ